MHECLIGCHDFMLYLDQIERCLINSKFFFFLFQTLFLHLYFINRTSPKTLLLLIQKFWKFAKWFIPLIGSFLANHHHSFSGGFEFSKFNRILAKCPYSFSSFPLSLFSLQPDQEKDQAGCHSISLCPLSHPSPNPCPVAPGHKGWEEPEKILGEILSLSFSLPLCRRAPPTGV
jgi:hypothetical protein